MKLYRYSLWNFTPGNKNRTDTFLRVTEIENAVVMPNAFYIPLMHSFEVLPITELGVVTCVRNPARKGETDENLCDYFDLYLPYQDFKSAQKAFVETLEKWRYPLQAECIRQCLKGRVRSSNTEFTAKEYSYLKEYDKRIGARTPTRIIVE